MCPWVGPEVWFRHFAYGLAGIVRKGHAQYTSFAPNTLIFSLGSYFLVSLYLLSRIYPTEGRHTVIFSTIQLLCILLLEEGCVQVQASCTVAKAPRSQPVSLEARGG